MILRLRSLLLSLAAASFLASGAHALTGPSAQRASSGVDPASIQYQRDGGLVSGVSFSVAATDGKQVRIRISATDGWHSCSAAGTSVHCAIPPRPVTDLHRLEIQTA
jgi:hypothetical protein